jgi:hypothetical protein
MVHFLLCQSMTVLQGTFKAISSINSILTKKSYLIFFAFFSSQTVWLLLTIFLNTGTVNSKCWLFTVHVFRLFLLIFSLSLSLSLIPLLLQPTLLHRPFPPNHNLGTGLPLHPLHRPFPPNHNLGTSLPLHPLHRLFPPNHNPGTDLPLHPLLGIPSRPNNQTDEIITWVLVHRYVNLLLKLRRPIICRWLESQGTEPLLLYRLEVTRTITSD